MANVFAFARELTVVDAAPELKQNHIMKTRIVATVVSFLLWTACGHAPASRLNRVSIGMTKAQVIQAMDSEPDSVAANGNKERLVYLLDAGIAPVDYWIVLVDGKVAGFARAHDPSLP